MYQKVYLVIIYEKMIIFAQKNKHIYCNDANYLWNTAKVDNCWKMIFSNFVTLKFQISTLNHPSYISSIEIFHIISLPFEVPLKFPFHKKCEWQTSSWRYFNEQLIQQYENITHIFVCLSYSNVCFEAYGKGADGHAKDG